MTDMSFEEIVRGPEAARIKTRKKKGASPRSKMRGEDASIVARIEQAIAQSEDPTWLSSAQEEIERFRDAETRVQDIEARVLALTGRTTYELADERKHLTGRVKTWLRQKQDPRLEALMKEWRMAMAEWNRRGERAGMFLRTGSSA